MSSACRLEAFEARELTRIPFSARTAGIARLSPSASFVFWLTVLAACLPRNVCAQVLHLPFTDGRAYLCSQGASGTTSHNIPSTQFDVDFDTYGEGRDSKNNRDEVVLAPVSGTAYAIRDPHPGELKGSGNHVNIEVASSGSRRRFVVLAHLKSFLIKEGGVFVQQGQPVGIEGTTGFSLGDHVHIGSHEGNPEKDAGESASIETTYIARDTQWPVAREIPSRDFSNINCNLDTGHRHVSSNQYPAFCTQATQWTFARDSQCWKPSEHDHGIISAAFDGTPAWILNVHSDPQIISPSLSIDASAYRAIQVTMSSTASNRETQLFWKRAGDVEFDRSRRVDVTISAVEGYQTYTYNLSGEPGWSGVITSLRFDPSGGGSGEAVGIQSIRLVPVGAAPMPTATPTPTPAPNPTPLPAGQDAYVDLGNPADELFHNLRGWGSISPALLPPDLDADRTSRYQLLRDFNSVDLFVGQTAVPHILTFRTEAGACDDSFAVYVNGRGPIFSYRHRQSGADPFPFHHVDVSPELISSRVVTVTFRNTATDSCGLAAVYSVRLASASPSGVPAITSITPSTPQTKQATWLTVRGSNFQEGVTVTVNGFQIDPAGLEFVNSNEVRVSVRMAGPGPYTARLVIANPNGETAEGTFRVIESAQRAPQISGVSPNSVAASNPSASSVEVTFPLNGTQLFMSAGSILPISVDAADPDGIAGIQFLVNGGGLGPEDSTPPYSYRWHVGTLVPGNFTVSAVSRDRLGNTVRRDVSVTISTNIARGSAAVSSGAYTLTVSSSVGTNEALVRAPVTFHAEFTQASKHVAAAACSITFNEGSWASSWFPEWQKYIGGEIRTTESMHDTGAGYSYTRSFDSAQIQRSVVECVKGSVRMSIGQTTTVNVHFEPTHDHRVLTAEEKRRLITPEDIEYMGAFRPPAVSEGEFGRYGFGLLGLTFYPGGDGEGRDDYPGSLFGTGHRYKPQIAEMSIPEPVVATNRRDYLRELPTAVHLHPFVELGLPAPSLYSIQYLPKQGAQRTGKIHWGFNSDYPATHGDAPTTGWSEADLDNLRPEGLWYVRGHEYPAVSKTLLEIPQEWADKYADGRYLGTGRTGISINSRWSHGPSLIALAPWQDGDPPPANSHLRSKTLLYYDPWKHDMKDWNWCDETSGGAWVTVGEKSAVVFNRDKSVGDVYYLHAAGYCGPNQTQLIFYDPDELAEVADGLREPYEPQQYLTVRLRDYLIRIGDETDNFEALGGMTFDRQRGILYLAQKDLGEWPVIHVFQLTDGCRRVNRKHGVNFANGIRTKLTVSDGVECAAVVDTKAKFAAAYADVEGAHIPGATCSAMFDDGTWEMTEEANGYEMARTFSAPGKYKYDVSCRGRGQNEISVEATVIVTR